MFVCFFSYFSSIIVQFLMINNQNHQCSKIICINIKSALGVRTLQRTKFFFKTGSAKYYLLIEEDMVKYTRNEAFISC